MFGWQNASIRKRLTWTNVIVSGAALSLASLSFLAYDFVTFRERMVRNHATQADVIGYNSISSLLFRDEEAARGTLAALRAHQRVISAAIYDKEGRRFASYVRDDQGGTFLGPQNVAAPADAFEFQREHLNLWRRITFEGESIGTVYVQADLNELYDRLWRVMGIGLLMFCMSTLVALLVSSQLQRAISGPVTLMAEAAKSVAKRNDYSVRVPATGRTDEMGLLVENFNAMLSQIQERDEALQKAHREVEQKVLERTEELRTTNTNLEAVNRELEAFSYSVSHDLRAPLRAIDGFSRILLEDYASQLGEDGNRQLLRVCGASQRMGHLIDDLLNLSRVTRNQMLRETVDLSDLAHRVARELQCGDPNRDVQLIIEPGLRAEADPHLTRAVLANLVGNAWKFTRKRAEPRIEVGAVTQNGQTAYFVRDNGAGFDMAYADKLFGAFQRLHRANEFEGSGIGLATVQRIVRRHGGKVWAESAVEQGATFYFTLAEHGRPEPTA